MIGSVEDHGTPFARELPAELGESDNALAPVVHPGRLAIIPEPWRARVTGRRVRRWRHAGRAIARYNARVRSDAATFNFYPMLPQPNAPISHIVRELGMRIGTTPRADEATIAWDGDTWFSARSARRLPGNAINGKCLDISKSRVHEQWLRVAGRTLAVAPTSYVGTMVEKPEENGRHGGRLVQGPLHDARRGHVYERLVDARAHGYVTQTRAILIGYELIGAYEKWRPEANLFFGTVLSLPRAPADLWSASEQAEIIALARAMDLEYGEIDIVRDVVSGAMHAVDVNRTPSQAHRLPERVQAQLWASQAAALRELLLAPRGF